MGLSPLFEDYWVDLAGNRIRRATKRELADAYRLWAKHRDIRRGDLSLDDEFDFGAWMATLPDEGQG